MRFLLTCIVISQISATGATLVINAMSCKGTSHQKVLITGTLFPHQEKMKTWCV
ncbi:hypothetical protein FKM82_025440 [Ascaphus truei]